jgi:hypothetical protein
MILNSFIEELGRSDISFTGEVVALRIESMRELVTYYCNGKMRGDDSPARNLLDGKLPGVIVPEYITLDWLVDNTAAVREALEPLAKAADA